jgi:hypothetical protein
MGILTNKGKEKQYDDSRSNKWEDNRKRGSKNDSKYARARSERGVIWAGVYSCTQGQPIVFIKNRIKY